MYCGIYRNSFIGFHFFLEKSDHECITYSFKERGMGMHSIHVETWNANEWILKKKMRIIFNSVTGIQSIVANEFIIKDKKIIWAIRITMNIILYNILCIYISYIIPYTLYSIQLLFLQEQILKKNNFEMYMECIPFFF